MGCVSHRFTMPRLSTDAHRPIDLRSSSPVHGELGAVGAVDGQRCAAISCLCSHAVRHDDRSTSQDSFKTQHRRGQERTGEDRMSLAFLATSPETGLTLVCSTHLSWILGFIFLVKDCNCQGHEKYLPLAHL